MKFTALSLLGLFGLASAGAGRPQLSINLKDGKFTDLDGLEPSISWGGSSTRGKVEVEYGVDLAARAATSDISSLTKSIWGKITRHQGGWETSARAEVANGKLDQAEIELEASSKESDLDVKLFASAGKLGGRKINGVEATKGFDMDGARLTFNPRYDVSKEEGDVVIGYSRDDTEVELTASKDDQSIKVSQQLDESNLFSPSVSRSGKISLQWKRKLNEDSTVTTTVRPNDAVNIKWKDNAWTANINIPIDGTKVGATSVIINREITF
mmetsp:Transcript_5921/g.8706  ORF Transcript_5921/g.8706 Transcript_5921/m.8706 type:complete len:269 (-) Transcript_5921:329-1135(-)